MKAGFVAVLCASFAWGVAQSQTEDSESIERGFRSSDLAIAMTMKKVGRLPEVRPHRLTAPLTGPPPTLVEPPPTFWGGEA